MYNTKYIYDLLIFFKQTLATLEYQKTIHREKDLALKGLNLYNYGEEKV